MAMCLTAWGGDDAAELTVQGSLHDVGGTNNPVTITEGEAFEIRGFSYAPGWKIVTSDFGSEIQELKVTNNRERSDSAIVEVKFMQGTEVLSLINCSTEPIDIGTTVTLSCSGDKVEPGYEKITISDAFETPRSSSPPSVSGGGLLPVRPGVRQSCPRPSR